MIAELGIFRCPGCGYESDLDGFDVIGADEGNLFCPQCHLEDEMLRVEGDGEVIEQKKKFKVSHIQKQMLAQMKERGVMGLAAVGTGKMACRALVRHGLATPKPNMESTYCITAAGRAWLASN